MEKVRAFVAIHAPPEVIEQLTELMAKLKRKLTDDAFRWVKVEQHHLTLQFLGYIPRDRVEEFSGAVEQAVSRNRTFRLKAESLGCFPNISRARVLWIGLTGQIQELQQLKSDLDKTLAPLGYRVEERPYHPHLTLARIAGPVANRPLFKQQIEINAAYSSSEFTVSAVHLMQSVLSPKGARYHSLGSFLLKSA